MLEVKNTLRDEKKICDLKWLTFYLKKCWSKRERKKKELYNNNKRIANVVTWLIPQSEILYCVPIFLWKGRRESRKVLIFSVTFSSRTVLNKIPGSWKNSLTVSEFDPRNPHWKEKFPWEDTTKETLYTLSPIFFDIPNVRPYLKNLAPQFFFTFYPLALFYFLVSYPLGCWRPFFGRLSHQQTEMFRQEKKMDPKS